MKLLLFPFILIGKLIEWTIQLTGRFIAIILGLIILILGLLLSVTIIGAILGIPLLLIGIGLIIRGIF
ncbi:hypothetical protein [Tissierella sp. Yu-01]|uniref:hypothetical protein n=1 Tax=Tissierella sp. Yu-01 TaxID=3035694 RepID=UPI00240E614F|nr:hypothetical protein [Tissierella sp. Yu-01]WFA09347.1 hypothetical protein P3962_01870 [Tissierella sp. Yu-01]